MILLVFQMANAWFTAHKSMLESHFSLVGDDGAKNIDEIETQLQKESEHLFTLWWVLSETQATFYKQIFVTNFVLQQKSYSNHFRTITIKMIVQNSKIDTKLNLIFNIWPEWTQKCS